MKLFGFGRSPYSIKVMLAVYEKGITFSEYESVPPYDPAAMARMRASEKLPLATVPLLRLDDGSYITESSIILEYFDMKYPEPRLIPQDPSLALEARAFDRQGDQLIIATNYLAFALHAPKASQEKIAKTFETMGILLSFFDEKLAGRTYLVGDGLTIADLAAAGALDVILRPRELDGVDAHAVDKFPNIQRWLERLHARPSWKRIAEDVEKAPRPNFPKP